MKQQKRRPRKKRTKRFRERRGNQLVKAQEKKTTLIEVDGQTQAFDYYDAIRLGGSIFENLTERDVSLLSEQGDIFDKYGFRFVRNKK